MLVQREPINITKRKRWTNVHKTIYIKVRLTYNQIVVVVVVVVVR